MSAHDDTRLLIGKIVGVFGVEGWVKIESFAEPRARIFKYQPWFVTSGHGGEREFVGAEGHAQGKGMVARLPGVGDRDAAAALLGAEIHILRSALPKPKRGEWYWADLEGLSVRNVEGVDLWRELGLVYRRDRSLPRAAQALISVIREHKKFPDTSTTAAASD